VHLRRLRNFWIPWVTTMVLACKERASCSCTECYWGGRMRSLQAATDSQGCGAGAANASFKVTFIVPRFFGTKPHPINEICT
jgi:hypothetical protein